jgi:hypothetical protein
MRFTILGGCLPPFLILLLLTFVGSVLLVLLLSLWRSWLVLIILLITRLLTSHLLEVGSKSKLSLESSELCLHGNDFLLIK